MTKIICLVFFLTVVSVVLARISNELKTTLGHGGVLVGRHLTALNGRNIRAYLGVPFAQPPIGQNRFNAPVPFGSWTGERMAIQDGSPCVQVNLVTGQQPTGSEDCLFLNVFVPGSPRLTNGSLPVVFWIHGGAYIVGNGGSTLYPPDYLMLRDVILVSSNHRLGPFGYLSTETLDASGNWGLKDQILALKWVQQNIAAFGGNPQSVTIAGWSSGASDVAYLAISPLSKGLFNKVILQSGSFKSAWGAPFPKGVAAAKATELAGFVNCSTSPLNYTSIVSCLRSKTAAELSFATLQFRQWDVYPFVQFLPVVEIPHEGAFMTTTPKSTPESLAMPVLTGYTKDEGLFTTFRLVQTPAMAKSLNENLSKHLPIILLYQYQPVSVQETITKSILDYYVKGGANFTLQNFQNFTDLISDAWMIAPMADYIQERLASKPTAPTYTYALNNKGYVTYTDFSGGEAYYGTAHGDDLLSLFPQATAFQPSLEPEARDRRLINFMVQLWTNFATFGNPTPASSTLPTWVPTTSFPSQLMEIGSLEKDGVLLKMGNSFPVERVNFWQKLGAFKYTT